MFVYSRLSIREQGRIRNFIHRIKRLFSRADVKIGAKNFRKDISSLENLRYKYFNPVTFDLFHAREDNPNSSPGILSTAMF